MRIKNIMRKSMLFVLVLGIMGTLTGCHVIKEKKYYLDKSNFITGTAKVENIIYDEENDSVYFWLNKIDEVYQDNTFKVEGKNVDILFEKNIFEMIEMGDEIVLKRCQESPDK